MEGIRRKSGFVVRGVWCSLVVVVVRSIGMAATRIDAKSVLWITTKETETIARGAKMGATEDRGTKVFWNG